MKIKTDQRIRKIHIKVAGEVAGLLEKNIQFEFSYYSDAQFPVAVSMSLVSMANKIAPPFRTILLTP
ncbi:hypothetical protein MNBD_GAMMA25-2409 [hydrothermal vent metagenome]|uniref:Uncharacterized protein n=1 Tax=hydrothermal vent metagenome TaxID=652676 RepID=A0A3B1BTL9_9ZZZZ